MLYKKIISLLLKYKKTVIIIAIIAFGLPVFLLPNKITNTNWYGKLYNYTLGNSFYTDNIKTYVNKTLGGSLRLFTWF